MPKVVKPPAKSASRSSDIVATLQTRFEENPHRHPGLTWKKVEGRLSADVLATLARMEETGGEPDVVLVEGPKFVTFVDCAPESPAGRRSLCYDQAAWKARKEARPKSNAMDEAKAMGVELLSEDEYRLLQSVEPVDRKTSSWVATPSPIRALGGALFCDRRYDHVFVYHNGAESYYAARGFRAKLRV